MHVTPTDFRDLGRGDVMDVGQRGRFGCRRAGHSDLKAYQEGSKEDSGFPSSVHIVGWRVSLFAQTSLEIVPLMINGMRAKKVSSETVLNSTCSLFN